MKKQPIKQKAKEGQTPPAQEQREECEIYRAPLPPSKGRIIGLDCHPDTFTAVVFKGSTPHNAIRLGSRLDMSLQGLLAWAAKEFTKEDLFLMEAGSNSFEIHRRLVDIGLRAVVMESCHVGKHAKTYADNDKMAAARIALVYLQGNAPCVWVPDPVTSQRRELLHAYNNAVASHVAASNSLKGYLNQYAVRLGRGQLPEAPKTETWLLRQRQWTPLQQAILADHLSHLRAQAVRRKELLRHIGSEICAEPLMLRCMKLLGIGQINAFALLAIIGDVRRFERPEKLVAYIGLNPGQRESGRGKHIRLGIGKRGRGDLRRLLVQGAHAVLRMGRATALGQWGWKLFARKGNRNVAVAAVARKMVVQVWHLLMGSPPNGLEPDKSYDTKLLKLAAALGKSQRAQLSLPSKIKDCPAHFRNTLTHSLSTT